MLWLNGPSVCKCSSVCVLLFLLRSVHLTRGNKQHNVRNMEKRFQEETFTPHLANCYNPSSFTLKAVSAMLLEV